MNVALYWFGTSLDPATDYDGWTTCRAGITETLVTVDKDYQIQPLLSDTWEQTDDSTWVMHIRDGVTFSDGTPVDAAAVKASFERAMEVQERAVTAAKIDSIDADGQNVTFHTSEPFGAFLANISEPLYSVIKVGDDQDYANAPIATGPYKVTGFTVNTEIDLVKNESYWGGEPGLDSITVKCIDDDTTRAMALQSGEMDYIQRIASTDMETFKNDSSYQLVQTAGARITQMKLNQANAFLADINVRKALAESIDYDSLVAIQGGAVTKAGAPYPSSAPYGYDDLENKEEYNAEEAKSLLEEAGFADSDGDGIVEKDGQPLTLKVTYCDAQFNSLLEAVQAMAKESGFDLQLNLVDDDEDMNQAGDYDILVRKVQTLSTGDPQWFLDTFFKSDGMENTYGYKSDKLDEVANKLTSAFDTNERSEITIEAEKVLLEDVPAIWLVCDQNSVVANTKVQNITPYPIDYYFIDKDLTMEG